MWQFFFLENITKSNFFYETSFWSGILIDHGSTEHSVSASTFSTILSISSKFYFHAAVFGVLTLLILAWFEMRLVGQLFQHIKLEINSATEAVNFLREHLLLWLCIHSSTVSVLDNPFVMSFTGPHYS